MPTVSARTMAKQNTGTDRSGPAPTALRLAGWTGLSSPVGAWQYGLPGLLRWPCPRGPVGAPQYGLPVLLFWFCSRCPKGHLSDDPLLPRDLSPSGRRAGAEGPALPLRSSALAAALAFLDVGRAARQGLLSSEPLTLLTPLPTPPPPPSSPLASPCLSWRGKDMLCPCPPRTI